MHGYAHVHRRFWLQQFVGLSFLHVGGALQPLAGL
jgi:hypothetical protein